MQPTTETAAIPHVMGWLTFEHTQRVGRSTRIGVFFAVDADAAAVYADRRDDDARLDTERKVSTVSVIQAAA